MTSICQNHLMRHEGRGRCLEDVSEFVHFEAPGACDEGSFGVVLGGSQDGPGQQSRPLSQWLATCLAQSRCSSNRHGIDFE